MPTHCTAHRAAPCDRAPLHGQLAHLFCSNLRRHVSVCCPLKAARHLSQRALIRPRPASSYLRWSAHQRSALHSLCLCGCAQLLLMRDILSPAAVDTITHVAQMHAGNGAETPVSRC